MDKDTLTRGGSANSSAVPKIYLVDGVPSGKVSSAQFRFKELFDVVVPMRDGVKLAVDIVLPEAEGPFPVILARTPYDKILARGRPDIEDFARRGYAVALQDCRGRFNSEGDFDPYRQEHADGFDTIEWIASQEWCDGNIGMIGSSYVGQTQWLAASQAPKALKAIVPVESPPGHPFMNEPFYGGAMILCTPEWVKTMRRRCFQGTSMAKVYSEPQDYYEALPLSKISVMAGIDVPWWEEWLDHPCFDSYWQSHGYEEQWSSMKVPALNISGWWGLNFIGAPRNFVGMYEHAATEEARKGQRLVIGPWAHCINRSRAMSGIDFGPQSVTDLSNYTLRFFDYWLKGKTDREFNNDPRVHVFVVGADQWWAANTWPLPGTKPTPLYLHSDGGANGHVGDGTASFDIPGNEPADQFTSDPNDPVRVPWDLHEGPVDDRPYTARPDVLCYTSQPLTEALDVVGDVKAVLYASSSALDCDWHVRLVDLYPDGAARFLCHGVLRARFREGFDRCLWLNPYEVTQFEIDMTATGVRFLPGHCIRIEISSSWFPRFDRNPQSGVDNWMRDNSLPVVAKQKIFHCSGHASHILLPVIKAAPS